jgi:hypothetical protein
MHQATPWDLVCFFILLVCGASTSTSKMPVRRFFVSADRGTDVCACSAVPHHRYSGTSSSRSRPGATPA